MKKSTATAATKTDRKEVMNMAWSIRRQNSFLSFSQCLSSAWKVCPLRAALRAGVARFTFQKNDGEVRQAVGTLNADLFNYTSKGSERAELPTVIKYFDLEKKRLPFIPCRTDFEPCGVKQTPRPTALN